MVYQCRKCHLTGTRAVFTTRGNMITHLGAKTVAGHDMGPFMCQSPGCGQHACRDNKHATVHNGHAPSVWARDQQLQAALSTEANRCLGLVAGAAPAPPPPPPPPPVVVVAAPVGAQGQANPPVAIPGLPGLGQGQAGPPAVGQNLPAAVGQNPPAAVVAVPGPVGGQVQVNPPVAVHGPHGPGQGQVGLPAAGQPAAGQNGNLGVLVARAPSPPSVWDTMTAEERAAHQAQRDAQYEIEQANYYTWR